MKSVGKIKGLMRDSETGRYILQLETDSRISVGYEDLKGETVDIIIRKHREKRSLDQNALYWSMVVVLAKHLGQSNAWVHNKMLGRYGVPYYYGNRVAMVVLPDGDPEIMESEDFHVRPTSDVREGKDGKQYRTYIVMRGSSTYNTAEMTRLVDGIESEVKNLGIRLEEHFYRPS